MLGTTRQVLCSNPRQLTNTTLPKPTDLSATKAKEPFCREVAATVGTSRSFYLNNLHWILVCTTSRHAKVQMVVSTSFLLCFFHRSHYPELPGHPSDGHMYEIMRGQLDRLQIANDVIKTFGGGCNCAKRCAWLKKPA